jgi:uridine kinase
MKNLIARFQDDVTVLSHDNYYRPYDELTIEERRNEKAQMNHVQKRFWKDMVEMQGSV